MITAPRILISGLKGGSGKTLLSLGLCSALVQRGIAVKPYKKGPDYIDAAWLAWAAGREATNLDPFFLSAPRLRSLFVHSLPQSCMAVLEGNRGLFDGRDVDGSCATAALAVTLQCPVLVSLDCTKMTRTAAALVLGLCHFDPRVSLAGVVLNQVGTARQESIIRQSIEHYTDVPVLGALPRLKANPLPERHMGLASHQIGNDCADNADSAAVRRVLAELGDFVSKHVDVARVQAIAAAAPALEPVAEFWEGHTAGSPAPRPRIGYVHDDVLWFYYAENLEALRRAGADLVRLSFADTAPWPQLDGLYLGGGFPEDSAPRLSLCPHLAELKAFSQDNMPIYAECGGFMVLSRAIARKEGEYPMAGVFPVRAEFHPRPQGLGYVQGITTQDTLFLPQGCAVRGHEFHYSRCVLDADAKPAYALQLDSGLGMGKGHDMLICNNTCASYTHIFAPALPQWAQNFVAAARAYAHSKALPSTVA